MKRLTKDTPATVFVEFLVAGEPVVPDNDSFTWTLVTESGIVVNSRQDVSGSVDAGMTETEIELTAADLASSKDYDLRLLLISFDHNSIPRSIEIYISIHDYVFIPVSKQRVRTLLSLQTDELPDEDINLLAGYHQLVDDLTLLEVTEARTAGGLRSMAIDELIAIYAAKEFLPSLKLRALRSQTDGELRYQRFDLDKVESIWEDLSQRAAKLKNQALGTLADTAVDEASYVLVQTTTPDDAITG